MKYYRTPGNLREAKTVKCGICGKEFETFRFNKQFCSPECRKVNQMRYAAEYREKNKDRIREWHRHQVVTGRRQGTSRCIICGELIRQSWMGYRRESKRMHDECVINDAKETLKAGGKLTESQRLRLHARGISIKELKFEVKTEDDSKRNA